MASTGKYVAYYRVSTKRQGQSGLGLDAQKQAVKAFVRGKGRVKKDFIEVETGKKNTRPELLKALARCKKKGETLVIAKLDRLSRNAGFIFALRDSAVNFVACDIPDANTMTVGIMAIMAQHEREVISARTKAALAAKKRQGFKLGKPENLTDEARAAGRAARNVKAKERQQQAFNVAKDLREQGLSLQKIGDKLTGYKIPTPRGGKWHKTSVKKLLALYE